MSPQEIKDNRKYHEELGNTKLVTDEEVKESHDNFFGVYNLLVEMDEENNK